MSQNDKTISGKIVDIINKRVFPGKLFIKGGKIHRIEKTNDPVDEVYLLPGLVDSHIHIESSMLSPQQFAHTAISHGTVATVSDPHEIANILGEEGIHFMLNNAAQSPLKFNFGVPSCVPSTPFETSGAVLDSTRVKDLLEKPYFKFLAEMMNFPGVVSADEEVLKKIQAAKDFNKPVDGHAPGLRGKNLDKYIHAGISTDHECNSYEEAKEKIEKGMIIQVREGSAARNFDALWPLIKEYPDRVMLCSDDRHPHDLVKGHINLLVNKGQTYGLNVFDLLKAATYNPVQHYNLDVGLLRKNDPADFILVDDLKQFNILATYINGTCYFDGHTVKFEVGESARPNIMETEPVSLEDIKVEAREKPIRVIHARDNELYTAWSKDTPRIHENNLVSNTDRDVLKLVVMNRYKKQKPAVGFIKNFGLTKGAIGTSIAHDSHNLIALGADDSSIVQCLNQLIEQKGGINVFDGKEHHGMQLEIAGLMTHRSAESVSRQYIDLTGITSELGCKLEAPFMTLSFMALPVIPELKLTDQGLFDVQNFEYTSLYL